LKWSGLDEFLQNKKSVTKEEVKEYLEKNSLDVSEIQRPRRITEAEAERELLLESKMLELDDNIEKFKKANPDANLTNDMEYFSFQYRDIDQNNFAKQDNQVSFNSIQNLLDDITEDELLNKYMYDDKIVFNYLVRDGQPFSRIGPINVAETDRFLQGGYSRQSRYEFEPLEIRKFFTSKELKDFNKTFDETKPKFKGNRYNEPGGDDYKELIFKLKGNQNYPIEIPDLLKSEPGGPSVRTKKSVDYTSPKVHFGVKNEFAHVRFKSRNLKGQKILAVEEMQSDLVTDMKQYGSADFPFKNNWYELVTKRLIRYAADNDFDAVAIPKAKVIQDRYKLTSRINNIEIGSFDPIRKEVGLEARDQDNYLQISDIYSFDKVEKEFGKDILEKIKDEGKIFYQTDDTGRRIFTSVEEPPVIKLTKAIEIGGKGKDALYNKTIPSFIKKYGKKWNAKVYDDVWDGSVEATTKRPGQPDLISPGSDRKLDYTIIQLTPEMKQSVQQDGQALFNIFGIGSAAAIGSDAVLQNDRNNTISNLTEN